MVSAAKRLASFSVTMDPSVLTNSCFALVGKIVQMGVMRVLMLVDMMLIIASQYATQIIQIPGTH